MFRYFRVVFLLLVAAAAACEDDDPRRCSASPPTFAFKETASSCPAPIDGDYTEAQACVLALFFFGERVTAYLPEGGFGWPSDSFAEEVGHDVFVWLARDGEGRFVSVNLCDRVEARPISECDPATAGEACLVCQGRTFWCVAKGSALTR